MRMRVNNQVWHILYYTVHTWPCFFSVQVNSCISGVSLRLAPIPMCLVDTFKIKKTCWPHFHIQTKSFSYGTKSVLVSLLFCSLFWTPCQGKVEILTHINKKRMSRFVFLLFFCNIFLSQLYDFFNQSMCVKLHESKVNLTIEILVNLKTTFELAYLISFS